MKVVLFCKKPYSFGIMMPLFEQLNKQKHTTIWYFPDNIKDKFPLDLEHISYSHSISDLLKFNADVNFVPGNDFPHYLPGVKVQLFHGLAGEKKSHFTIRHYFDLYLTSGPYFTDKFNKLAKKYKNFTVTETGWCKLDTIFSKPNKDDLARSEKNTILYAPTFSKSLTSAIKYKDSIIKLANNPSNYIYIKFHDLTDPKIIDQYRNLNHNNIEIYKHNDIIPLLKKCDLLISDTSSVVYEFLLLNKPVITLESRSPHICWENILAPENLEKSVIENIRTDPYQKERKWIIYNYHPYTDGNSSSRVIEAAQDFINTYGVPTERKLPFLRRLKMIKQFGKKPVLK